MNVIVHGYVAMSVTLAYIALAILVLGGLRIAVPAPKDTKGRGLSPAQRRKHRDNVTTFNEHALFVVRLFLAFTILYPAWVGFLYVAHLTKVF